MYIIHSLCCFLYPFMQFFIINTQSSAPFIIIIHVHFTLSLFCSVFLFFFFSPYYMNLNEIHSQMYSFSLSLSLQQFDSIYLHSIIIFFKKEHIIKIHSEFIFHLKIPFNRFFPVRSPSSVN